MTDEFSDDKFRGAFEGTDMPWLGEIVEVGEELGFTGYRIEMDGYRVKKEVVLQLEEEKVGLSVGDWMLVADFDIGVLAGEESGSRRERWAETQEDLVAFRKWYLKQENRKNIKVVLGVTNVELARVLENKFGFGRLSRVGDEVFTGEDRPVVARVSELIERIGERVGRRDVMDGEG